MEDGGAVPVLGRQLRRPAAGGPCCIGPPTSPASAGTGGSQVTRRDGAGRSTRWPRTRASSDHHGVVRRRRVRRSRPTPTTCCASPGSPRRCRSWSCAAPSPAGAAAVPAPGPADPSRARPVAPGAPSLTPSAPPGGPSPPGRTTPPARRRRTRRRDRSSGRSATTGPCCTTSSQSSTRNGWWNHSVCEVTAVCSVTVESACEIAVERAQRGADEGEVGGVGEQRLVQRARSSPDRRRCASTTRASGGPAARSARSTPPTMRGLPRHHRPEVVTAGLRARPTAGGGPSLRCRPGSSACIDTHRRRRSPCRPGWPPPRSCRRSGRPAASAPRTASAWRCRPRAGTGCAATSPTSPATPPAAAASTWARICPPKTRW